MKQLATLAFLTCLIGLVIPANGQDFTYTSTVQASWEDIDTGVYTPTARDTVTLYVLAGLYTDRSDARGQVCGNKAVIKPYNEVIGVGLAGFSLYPCYDNEGNDEPIGRLPVTDTASAGDSGFIVLRDSVGYAVLAVQVNVVSELPPGKSGSVTFANIPNGEPYRCKLDGGETIVWTNGPAECVRVIEEDDRRKHDAIPGITTGGSDDSATIDIDDKAKVTLAESEPIPTRFLLNQNYPNPFNPATTIDYELQNSEDVTLTVYDMRGARIALLVDGVQAAGTHSVRFNGSHLPSGMYMYILDVNGSRAIQKMVLTK